MRVSSFTRGAFAAAVREETAIVSGTGAVAGFMEEVLFRGGVDGMAVP